MMKKLQYDAIVIGTGCAGYNCADWLYDLGIKNIAIVTEGRLTGTSRNTGSDKQTYYKLSLAGDNYDCVKDMANTLFSGGAMDGDIALAEAANSTRCFLKLASLGVPFPTNEYGEFVGYKTDHDPACRATSIGPYTSKKMTEVLEANVMKKGIQILDSLQVTKLLKDKGQCIGVLALNLASNKEEFVAIQAPYVVLATGGPAYLYKNSVYPEGHTGASALALDAGATFQNLSEWQYGLASIDFRWNVSGTYQQVLPKYISIDENGVEREFLLPYFKNPYEMLKNVFLKGYEWPFDVRKIQGSSYVDLLVYRESVVLGRKVYMDFRYDPTGIENGFENLDETSHTYLKNSDALVKTPIERLKAMNPGAISLYLDHGIDLYKEPLRIAVCAQHHNGGIGVDANWQSNLQGLYVVGEAAGTFGVFRPGGTALNSTQVGSLRASDHIRYHGKNTLSIHFDEIAQEEEKKSCAWVNHLKGNTSTILKMRDAYQSEMSLSFAFLRNIKGMKASLEKLQAWDKTFDQDNVYESPLEIGQLFKNREILSMSMAVANAMIYAAEHYGSRGSCMVLDNDDLLHPNPLQENAEGRKEVLLTSMQNGKISSSNRPVRPIPDRNLWFETVWKTYRKEKGES